MGPPSQQTGIKPDIGVHYRVRRERIDPSGVITIRYDSRLRHIGLGHAQYDIRVLALIADRYIRIIDAHAGQLLRELSLGPMHVPMHETLSGESTASG